MENRLHQLEVRLARAEQEQAVLRRRMHAVASLALSALIAVPVVAGAQPAATYMASTRRGTPLREPVRVLNRGGRSIMEIGANPGGTVHVFNPHGQAAILLGAIDGEGVIQLYEASGRGTVTLARSGVISPGVSVTGASDRIVAGLGDDGRGGGGLVLWSPSGRALATFGWDICRTPLLEVFEVDGRAIATIGSDADGGFIRLYSRTGEVTFQAP